MCSTILRYVWKIDGKCKTSIPNLFNANGTKYAVERCAIKQKKSPTKHMRTKYTTTQYILNGWMESTWECAEYLQDIFFTSLVQSLCNRLLQYFFLNMWTLQTIRFGKGARYLQNDKQLVEENYRYFIAFLCALVCNTKCAWAGIAE